MSFTQSFESHPMTMVARPTHRQVALILLILREMLFKHQILGTTMKYFLALSILCTIFSTISASAHCGATLGSIEVWSDWMPLSENDDSDVEVDLKKVCNDVMTSYNELNVPRGYFGQLEQPLPVGRRFRPLDGEPTERQYSCILRVKKFDVE